MYIHTIIIYIYIYIYIHIHSFYIVYYMLSIHYTYPPPRACQCIGVCTHLGCIPSRRAAIAARPAVGLRAYDDRA